MKRQLFCTFSLFLCCLAGMAQPPRGDRPNGALGDSWEVSVNQMKPASQEKVNQIVEELQAKGGATRSILAAVGGSMLAGATSAIIDVAVTEIVNAIQYKQKKKKEWRQMIERECNYTDSITSIKGLKDFYGEVSTLGALDPSNINFDGISLRGTRDGEEVLYMSCHIDTTRLDHMFQHSKFNLVLDTLIFHPYQCHLPNLQANGIRLLSGQTSERDNSFSFDERQNLRVALEMTLSSSWINEAVMVMDNVELGKFKLNIDVTSAAPEFIYSRRQIERNRAAGLQRDTTFIDIEGDCFVVPRSYMPISGGKRMWGTGEYNVKVKMRETCQFVNDKDRNKKMKQWYKDYRQMRKLQKQNGSVGQYFKTLWQQHGNTLIKQVVKSGLTTGVQSSSFMQSISASGQKSGMSGGAAGGTTTPPAAGASTALPPSAGMKP